MAKKCKAENCGFNVFSNGYCKPHQYMSEKFKLKQTEKKRIPIKRTPIKKVAIKRVATKKSTTKKVGDRIPLPTLIKECDYLFSRLLRNLAKDKQGNVKCFTCSNKVHWTLIQAGHYVSRGNMKLRFSTFNVRPQCEDCNMHKRGNLTEYGKRLKQENEHQFLLMTNEINSVNKVSYSELIQLKKDLINDLTENNFEFKLKND